MKIEIDLKFNPEDFKEIYYRDLQGNYFRGPTTQRAFITLLILIALEIIVLSFFSEIVMLKSVVTIALIICLGNYMYVAYILWKWKKQIRRFLKREGAYSKHRLILTEKAFCLVQDELEHIEKWQNLKSADITPTFLKISGKQEYLIPMKSIGYDQYELLRKIVAEKTK